MLLSCSSVIQCQVGNMIVRVPRTSEMLRVYRGQAASSPFSSGATRKIPPHGWLRYTERFHSLLRLYALVSTSAFLHPSSAGSEIPTCRA